MTTIDSDANGYWYYIKNTYPLSEDTFAYEFQVSYNGPTAPEGRCFSNLGGGNGGGGGGNPSTTPSGTVQPTTSTPWSK